MKVILDECLPKRLIRYLPEYEVTTVPLAGLAGYTNGRLLAAIERDFDVFLTAELGRNWFDRNCASRVQ